jgi:hypothetical protein
MKRAAMDVTLTEAENPARMFFQLQKNRKSLQLMFDPEPVKRDYCRDTQRSVSFRTDPPFNDENPTQLFN